MRTLPAILSFRMLVNAGGHENANDCDELRSDTLFKLAVKRDAYDRRTLTCAPPVLMRQLK